MNGLKARQAGFVDVNGARLHYEAAGEGPAVVLIHAGIADARMWDPQFAAFAQHCRVIRYDVRGYGRSAMVAGLFSHHDDLRGLLDTLGVVRAALVGLSLGGRIAVDFALVYPEMVERLVLANAGLHGWRWSEAMQRLWQEEEAAIERRDLDAAAESNLRVWVDGPARSPEQVDPAVRARVREMMLPTLAPAAVEGEQGVVEPPAAGRVGEIRAPTLVVVADGDQPDILAIADHLTTAIPAARKALIHGAAHMVNMERPDEFNRIVLEFLGRSG